MLKQRVITAVAIALPLLLMLTVLPPLPLMVVFAVVVLLAAWEWSDLAGLKRTPARVLYTLAVAGLLGLLFLFAKLLAAVPDASLIRNVLHVAGLWWALALLWVMGYPGSAVLWGNSAVRVLIGFLVLVPTWLALYYLRLQEQGALLILYVLLTVVAADIGAYFAGRRWGRAKLAVKVSPGKSWAGFWGGLAASQALALIAAALWPGGLRVSLAVFLVLSAVASLASVLGDLLESMIKRQRGVKDSGTLLPGHGGLMDRLDSLTAAIPVFTLGLMLAEW